MGKTILSKSSLSNDKLREYHSLLSKNIIDKVEKIGISRPPSGSMGANLSDIYIEVIKYQNLLDRWLTIDNKEKKAMGEVLVYMNTSLEHINYHIKHVRRSLQRVINYCYEENTNEKP
jgi:hypothetical protein